MEFSTAPQVSPRKGRWIEIIIFLQILIPLVSPRKGRWIEINSDYNFTDTETFLPVRGDGLKFVGQFDAFRWGVSPRKGRWIEISKTSYKRLEDGFSP